MRQHRKGSLMAALIDLTDARRTLGDLPVSQNDQLNLYIDATTEIIEDICGPVVPRVVTEVVSGGSRVIILANQNVSDVTLTVSDVELVLDTEYTLDAAAGVLYAGTTTAPTVFGYGIRNGTVTYTAGFDPIPANLTLAALEQLRFLWQLSMQGNRPAYGEAPLEEEHTPSGFAVPRRVIQLCAGYRRPPVVA